MPSRKKGTLLITALLMVAAVTATAAVLRLQEQGKSKSDDPNGPTPVQEGVKTERQRRHGKLFPYNLRKLRELVEAREGDGDIEVGVYGDFARTIDPNAPKIPAVQAAVCNADAIFVGTLKSKSSQLTADESFIFTDYEMTVEEVVKDNPAAPARVGGDLTVVGEGGAVSLNGRTVRARRDNFKIPEVGKRYLLFLRFIPETGSYLSYPYGIFHLDGERVVAFHDEARVQLLDRGAKNLPTLLGEVRASTAAACPQK